MSEDEGGGPLLPTSAGSDRRLMREIKARMRREEKARRRLVYGSAGSRVARGCSAAISGVAALGFGSGTLALVWGMIERGASVGFVVAAGLFAAMTGGFGYLTLRWLRGFNPMMAIPDPHPDEIKRLAAELHEEDVSEGE